MEPHYTPLASKELLVPLLGEPLSTLFLHHTHRILPVTYLHMLL